MPDIAPDFVSFPGLRISRADFVFTHGVTPSACIVTCIPQNFSFTTGPLTFYSRGQPLFAFQQCTADHSFTNPPMIKRGQRIVLRILDRRWKWSRTLVDGRYNVRRPDGYARPETKRTYYQLIELLLQSMGELKYSIKIPYPQLEGPTVNWSAARADLELAKLVEEIGCIVYLGLDDMVYVTADGTGKTWSKNGREREPIVEFYPSSLPDWVQTTFAPIRYQSKILLRAVGLDRNGEIWPIDQLLYKPAGGWSKQVPGVFNDVTDDFDRELARMTVYKWYKVATQWDKTLTLPGGKQTISTIDDILPLRPDLIMPQPLSGNAPLKFANWPPSRPFIEGYFFNSDLTGLPEQGTFGKPTYAKFDDIFELDLENGIAKFYQPMFKVDSDGHQTPATLYLECSYQARANPSSTDWYWLTQTKTGVPSTIDGGIAEVERPDLWLYWVVRYATNTRSAIGLATNYHDIMEIGRQQGESYRYHFTNYPRSCMQWAGIIPVPIQGNVHQVRWVVGDGPAMTYASRSCEIHTWGPSRYERQLREEAERHMHSIRR